MSLTISIIIPVFNTDKYLSACLDSIVYQIDNDVEIIIVNDGSTDNSGHIADSYAQQYKCIRVMHQSNQGVSAARNIGLSYATGEYIWFVDSDDIIENTSSLLKAVKDCAKENVDLLLFRVESFSKENTIFPYMNGKYSLNHKIKLGVFKDDFLNLLSNNLITYYAVDKIIRKEVVSRNNLKFPTRHNISEDFYWNIHLFNYIQSYCVIDEVFYNYRINRFLSATNTLDKEKLSTIIKVIKENIEYSTNIFGTNLNYVSNVLLYISRVWFYVVPESYLYSKKFFKDKESEFKEIYDIFTAYNIPLQKFNRGANLLNRLISIFGFSSGLKLYSMLIIVKRKLSRI